MLGSVLTEARVGITALAWHPTRKHLLATATSDDRLCVWDVRQQRVLASVALTTLIVHWNPFERYTKHNSFVIAILNFFSFMTNERQKFMVFT